MLENLTERARRTLFFARYEAAQAGALAIGSEHLLLGLLRELKRHFPPEFVNRLDDVVVFQPLSKDQLRAVARLLIGDVVAHLASRGLALDVAAETAEWLLAQTGGEQAAGARPLRRVVKGFLEDAVSDYLISHRGTGAGSLRTQVEDGRLLVTAAEGVCVS